MERFAQLAAEALTAVLENPIAAEHLEIPPDPALGDFAFPCFRMAKEARKAPPQVAQDLAARVSAWIQQPSNSPRSATDFAGIEVRAAGPYVNFVISPALTFKTVLGGILSREGQPNGYGKHDGAAGSRGVWVLEYSSPNVAKPFQIYHLRPTALGAALERIGRLRGYQVHSINHLGDWGTQYGKLAVALQLYGAELPSEPTIMDLVQIYVRFHAEAEKDPSLNDQARAAFLRLEKDDPEMRELWKRCVDISMKEFLRIYARLGVQFDHIWGESYYKDQLAPLLKRLRDAELLIQSEGAWVVPVTDRDGKELPPCILEKSDGATIYATRDVAAAIYRHDKFNFDRMTYIVGAEQRLHFQQVFGVLRKLGLEWEARCEHVPFGLYRFKDAKMSTRKGNFVTLEDVLTIAKDRVRALMEERARANPESAAVQAARDAGQAAGVDAVTDEATLEAIALGAVVFNDLHTDPARDVEFDVEKVVDFNGETGPYVQYAHTRCLSIQRRARDAGVAFGDEDIAAIARLSARLTQPQEIQLARTLGRFPTLLERTLKLAKASQLAHYLIDVTQTFGLFYRECRVISEDAELSQARLLLVRATRDVLSRGLALLGVPVPERM